jgi:small conductance mechanosensitive channel
MIVSALLIAGLRMLSHLVIYSSWGPLKYVFRHHKSKIMTIHSLVLNLLKYVVYFTAFGFILSELGVNYKAYLASLSVVGLAIGFGSQGLVQDVVTGFFLIFEGQVEVGDMVEISGQTGIVEELGLRVTKLRNYLGQLITIPNRNIALVGTYTKGALQVFIDVALMDEETAASCSEELQQIGNEVNRQFEGVILKNPRVLSPLSLETGEHFVRMQFEIWPQQQWVIEQQVIPRIREIFKRKGIEIAADRIVAFYHAREERSVLGWREFLGKTKEPLEE